MLLLEKREDRELRHTGRLSDGSDRRTELVSTWHVTVADEHGRVLSFNFSHDPSDNDIMDRFRDVRELRPTKERREDVEQQMEETADRIEGMRKVQQEADAADQPVIEERIDALRVVLKGLVERWKRASNSEGARRA